MKATRRIMPVMRYKTDPVASPQVESAILLVRGQRVLLDRDLALLYGF